MDMGNGMIAHYPLVFVINQQKKNVATCFLSLAIILITGGGEKGKNSLGLTIITFDGFSDIDDFSLSFLLHNLIHAEGSKYHILANFTARNIVIIKKRKNCLMHKYWSIIFYSRIIKRKTFSYGLYVGLIWKDFTQGHLGKDGTHFQESIARVAALAVMHEKLMSNPSTLGTRDFEQAYLSLLGRVYE
ncbi:hypothetical protein ACJX0J_037677 [Zea mays]